MRRVMLATFTATAMFTAAPALASVTVTPTNGTPLDYMIYGIKGTGNPVYGSSPTNSNTANVTFTGNATTNMDITNGYATITDANKQNSQLFEIILDPTQYDFSEMKFALQLTAAGSFDVYYLLSGSGLNPEDFASYTSLAGSFSQTAKDDNKYDISGGTIDSIMIKVTTPGVYLYQVEQMSYQPAAAVPEPATWAMMLLGFGGIGLAMRRRARPGSADEARRLRQAN